MIIGALTLWKVTESFCQISHIVFFGATTAEMFKPAPCGFYEVAFKLNVVLMKLYFIMF